MKNILEICCDSVQSAIFAEKGGADRIELCENLDQGGVSPSAGKIILCKKYLQIPIFVLIRPRKADFYYNNLELESMIKNIQLAKELGADGIVSGCLKVDGTIDTQQTKLLIEAAAPLPFTFHRAFDRTPNPEKALEQLTKIGVARILTSGQKNAAVEGKDLIAKLAHQAGDDIIIMVGGKVRPENIDILKQIPHLNEFHSSAKKTVQSRTSIIGTAQLGSETLEKEYTWEEVDEKIVKALKMGL